MSALHSEGVITAQIQLKLPALALIYQVWGTIAGKQQQGRCGGTGVGMD